MALTHQSLIKGGICAILSIATHLGVARVLRGVAGDSRAAIEVAAPTPTANAFRGDTFEIGEGQEDHAAREATANVNVNAETPASESPQGGTDGTSAPRPVSPPAPPKPARASTHVKSVGVESREAESSGGLFGAVGDRTALDLASAFTHALGQVGSADPSWTTAPLGDAGAVDVTITLDETGRIAGFTTSGGGSAALRSTIARAAAWIGPRTFTAHAARSSFQLHGRIAANADPTFGISDDLYKEERNAWFTLTIGRRIDISVRPLHR